MNKNMNLKAVGEKIVELEQVNGELKERLDIVETEVQCAQQTIHNLEYRVNTLLEEMTEKKNEAETSNATVSYFVICCGRSTQVGQCRKIINGIEKEVGVWKFNRSSRCNYSCYLTDSG